MGIHHSYLPLPSAQEHSDIYLQVCNLNGRRVFLITLHVTTRLLVNEIELSLAVNILNEF